MSRSISRLCLSLSRRELTEAVAAACFSLSSATDAMAPGRGRTRLGMRAPVVGRGDLVGSAHGDEIPMAVSKVREAHTEVCGGGMEEEEKEPRRATRRRRRRRWRRRGETDKVRGTWGGWVGRA